MLRQRRAPLSWSDINKAATERTRPLTEYLVDFSWQIGWRRTAYITAVSAAMKATIIPMATKYVENVDVILSRYCQLLACGVDLIDDLSDDDKGVPTGSSEVIDDSGQVVRHPA